MPNDPKPIQCGIAEAIILPRLGRVEDAVSAQRETAAEHDLQIQRIHLKHDEANRRITILERLMSEEQAENRGMRKDIQGLQASMMSVGDQVSRLAAGQERFEAKLERHLDDMQRFQADQTTKISAIIVEGNALHAKRMRSAMFFAFSVAGLVAVLGALHGVIAGVPLGESIAAMLARLGV
jgi:chromosome segregation ATPase